MPSVRRCLLLISVLALPALAGLQVPGDVGIGPAGFWFFGPLTANRGAVPHFGLVFDLEAIIDRDWIEANQASIPDKYKGMADQVTELKIGASIFIPSTLYISPPIDAFKSTGLFGATWAPLGLTLLTTGKKSAKEWNQSRGSLTIDAHLLLTYMFIFNTGGYDVATTHFLRPGLQLRSSILLTVTNTFFIGLGGGAQIYIPQRIGPSFGIGPIDENIWLSVFAFVQFHVRFPYEVSL